MRRLRLLRKNLSNMLARLASFKWDELWRSVMTRDKAYVPVMQKLGNGRGEKLGT
jgi:hypothetical protein